MPRIADRVGTLGTETALDVLVKARAVEARGRKVIHLEVGEPDFPTPEHIVEAGIRALREGKTRYGAPSGLPARREEWEERIRIACWSRPARSPSSCTGSSRRSRPATRCSFRIRASPSMPRS